MKVLYSLVCRLRTLYALVQGMAAVVSRGWAAVPPAQLLLLGCGLCIALRVLIPSPSGRERQFSFLDRCLSVAAVASVVGLTASGVTDSCALVGRFVLGL